MRPGTLLVLTGCLGLFSAVTYGAAIPQQSSDSFIVSQNGYQEQLDVSELYPGDVFVNSSLLEAIRRVDSTIRDGMTTHHDTERAKARSSFLDNLHEISPEVQKEARAAAIVEETLHLVLEKVETREKHWVTAGDMCDIRKVISPFQRTLIANKAGCKQPTVAVNCSSHEYRTIDGSCNNIENPQWGAAVIPFKRFVMPLYEDGRHEPIGWNKSREYNGFPLPSARYVSNKLLTSWEVEDDPEYTYMLNLWGQFLLHDLAHTSTAVSITTTEGEKMSCADTCENANPCFPISIPGDDPLINNAEKPCLPYTRSGSMCAVGGMTSPDYLSDHEQMNQVSSFIDASMVYGSSDELAQSLRDWTTDGGLLRVQKGADISSGLDLLPFEDGKRQSCNQDPGSGDIVLCFLAGDSRVNEASTLTALYTIFHREHNRIVRQLTTLNPHWGGERLYQEARKIVSAEVAHITFSEFLPKLLGQKGMEELEEDTEYNPHMNPSVRNAFATAAFRLSEATSAPLLKRFNEHYEEDPHIVNVPVNDSGLDPLVRGLFISQAETLYKVIHEDLTQHLFQGLGQFGPDIAAINIQRGRDHGLPLYNNWRVFCGLSFAASFQDLAGEISNADVRQKLSDVYGDVNNIDLWPAGLLEDYEPGARVGPTFRCIIAEQLKMLRQGDRFWHENFGVFTAAQRAQVGRVTLARVVCDNTGVPTLPRDVFVRTDVTDMAPCDSIPGMQLQVWQEDYDDINECEDPDLNDCEQLCTNTAGSYLCACQDGLVLRTDGRSCASCEELYPDLAADGDFGVHENTCFWFSSLREGWLTYIEAKQACLFHGGKLAMIKDAGVQTFIEKYLRKNRHGYREEYFFGLDNLLAHSLAWSDGSELRQADYSNWITDHAPHHRGNYGTLLENQKWTLTRGPRELPYICQMDMICDCEKQRLRETLP